MKIRQLNTDNPQDVRQFVNFQFDLYADCDKWAPPLVSSVKLAMNRHKHHFYTHSDAAFFVAEEDGQTIARVAMIDHQHYNDYTQHNAAFLHYFDARDNVAAVQQLLDSAVAWAKARGRSVIYGPKGMLRTDSVGILIEGFEVEAASNMPYNYAYYPQLLEVAGFEKEKDYRTGYLTPEQYLSERMFKVAEKIKKRRGFWVKTFKTKRELRPWLSAIQQVNNAAFTQVWGYYPIDTAEVEMIRKQLLAVANPRLLKLVMKGDKIAGFAFVFPNISAALRETRGRLWPWGWLKILRALKTTRKMSGNGVGLLPQYQGLGATTLLYVELDKTLHAVNAISCDITYVMESNVNSLGDMNMLGVNWDRRHRVYRRALD